MSPDGDVNPPFWGICFEVCSNFPCRSEDIGSFEFKSLIQHFVVVRDLHLPEIQIVGIDTLETVRLLSNDGLFELTNELLAADFDGKTVFVTVDPAVQGYSVRHPGLSDLLE